MIINEAKNRLGVKISGREIRKIQNIRREISCRAMVVLMTIYNLLKAESDEYNNALCIKMFMENSITENEKKKEFYQLCFDEKILEAVYNHSYFGETNRYEERYHFYCDTYTRLNKRFGNKRAIEILQKNFPDELFDNNDIPKNR